MQGPTLALQDGEGGAESAARSQPARLRVLWGALGAASARARVDLALWAPVALGVGIGAYFRWPDEPAAILVAAAAGAAAILLLLWGLGPEGLRFPAACLALAAAGFALAAWRAQSVAAPVLSQRYYGAVEGRVIEVDRSGADFLRLTLDELTLDELALAGASARDSPRKAAISLRSDGALSPPEGGSRVRIMAHLSPPAPPVEPGAWDFRRTAWFQGLGAVGYARAPPEIIAPPSPRGGGLALAGQRARMALSAAMQARMEGQPGAIAAALMTGDRSAISARTNDVMRISGLYHIVSISGLHMGMLAGFVFAAIRYGLAAAGRAALVWPTKKIAAVAALAAATVYLWIAGPEVATQRSYIMAAVMLTAVMLDRRALSLRTLAVAAFLLLALKPEGLTEAGFQMSFAATAGLIVMLGPWTRLSPHVPRLLRPLAALALTSLVAGTITAPIAAAHFGRLSAYGLVANLLAVPVMGTLVMPAGVIAAALGPLGLAAPALWVMQAGCGWMLAVAEWVAALGGADAMIPRPPGWVLPTLALGAAAAVLTRARARLAACLALCAAFAGWATVERPTVLIAPEGVLVGVMTDQGRALSKPVAGFVARRWLEADGDPAEAAEAAARPGFVGPRGARVMDWNGGRVTHLSGKGAAAGIDAACRDGALVVVAQNLPGWPAPRPGCDLWDAGRLSHAGAVAVMADGRVLTSRDIAGARPWTDWRLRRGVLDARAGGSSQR